MAFTPKRRRARLERLENRQLLALTISEIQSVNHNTLDDRYGESSDWIELLNTGTLPLPLNGYTLEEGNRRFALPNETLEPQERLLVFASGRDEVLPSGELHANFRLAGDGGRLELHPPLGEPEIFNYPAIPADRSYGRPMSASTEQHLLSLGETLEYLIPVDGSLDIQPGADAPLWAEPSFLSQGWSQTQSGVGYGLTPSCAPAITRSPDPVSPQSTVWSSIIDFTQHPLFTGEQGQVVELTAGNIANSSQISAHVNGTEVWAGSVESLGRYSFYVDAAQLTSGQNTIELRHVAGDEANFRELTIAGSWQLGNADTSDGEFAFEDNRDPFCLTDPWQEFDRALSQRDLFNDIRFWMPAEASTHDFRFEMKPFWSGPASGIPVTFYLNDQLIGEPEYIRGLDNRDPVIIDISAAQMRPGENSIRVVHGGPGEYITFDYFRLSVLEDRDPNDTAPDTLGLIGGDELDMSFQASSTSLFVRSPFAVDDPANFNQVTVELSYNDGFVAYLNGTEIGRANAPNDLTWQSAATANVGAPNQFGTTSISVDASLLQTDNVLAIHGLNETNDDAFVIAPTVRGRFVSIDDTPGILASPSPAETNTGLDVTPAITALQHSPAYPIPTEDIVVTAAVQAKEGANIASVDLTYRVQYNPSVTAAMLDDGVAPDVIANDGIYTGTIPGMTAASGEMVRWFVEAHDDANNSGREPAFLFEDASPEYQGTVVGLPLDNASLPVFHLFLENATAADNPTGTRASVFAAGQFYDNVHLRPRGLASFNERWLPLSYKLDFLPGQLFQYDGQVHEEVNLNTTYADKAMIRQPLSFDVYAAAGVPASQAFPVEVRRNGEFYSVSVFVEQPDEHFLERHGFDPDGALYKMFSPDPNQAISEKKTRLFEDNMDMIDLDAGLRLRQLGGPEYMFDNINIPQVVNYFAATLITNDSDHILQNHYLYRDSDGTGEWSTFPWDKDLTWGRHWDNENFLVLNDLIAGADPNDVYNTRPLEPFFSANVLFAAMVENPAIREMYLRRVRSLVDQFFQSPETPPDELYLESHVDTLAARVAPLADQHVANWPYAYGTNQDLQTAVNILKTEHLEPRRAFLNGLTDLPDSQPDLHTLPVEQREIEFGQIEASPLSGNQDEEFIEIWNRNSFAVDVSNWTVAGGIEFTFKPGTVLPENSRVFLSPSVATFRNRAASPTGDEAHFVQGDYQGHLSAFGEELILSDSSGNEIVRATYDSNPSPAQEFLRITEINYHPHQPTPDEAVLVPNADDNAFEFIEVLNTGPSSLGLSGVSFSGGIQYDFPNALLSAGEYAVIVNDRAAFEARYGVDIRVLGEFTSGQLSNSGEEIRLDDATGSTIHSVDYRDNNAWGIRADGHGSSLELLDIVGDVEDVINWRVSVEYGGSPGRAGIDHTSVLINEVYVEQGLVTGIELYNQTAAALNLGGWQLALELSGMPYSIANNTQIAAGEYLVLEAADIQGGELSHDAILEPIHAVLVETDGDQPMRFADDIPGVTTFSEAIGRWSDSADLIPMSIPTPGAANERPRVGPVTISEVMYDTGVAADAPLLEFVELVNTSADAIDLTGWEIEGINFTFPSVSIDSGATLIVVPFAPENQTLRTQFTNHYGIDENVAMVGPFPGRLNNAGEHVRLWQFAEFASDMGPILGFILADEADYDEAPPWPAIDETVSLSRTQTTNWGSNPEHWEAATPSPGEFAASTPPVVAGVRINQIADPPDLPTGPQPSSWDVQRSLLHVLEIVFDQEVIATRTDVEIFSLGLDGTGNERVPILNNMFELAGATIRLTFDQNDLPNGVLRLRVLPSVTSTSGQPLDGNSDGNAGDLYELTGDSGNRMYQLASDLNGDLGVSIFDFGVFAYWFGNAVGIAPAYVDLNHDLGVSIFDFSILAELFGTGVVLPAARPELRSAHLHESMPTGATVAATDLVLNRLDEELLFSWARID